MKSHYDVVILGAGLAGLSLARQLLLSTQKDVLLLEKRTAVPPSRQKVGEATVQLSGYYFSKTLDLEEHLLSEHFMKYNLRFFWKTPGLENDAYEDYSQSYIRNLSNIATYQLDRNKLEGELLRLNRENERFEFHSGVSDLDVALSVNGSSHKVSFGQSGQRIDLQATWVVDTTGRAKFLARRLGITKSSPLRHGATFFWVDGLVNVEKLTALSHPQSLTHKNRTALGHLPVFLSTNHFMGEGYWFWIIPLHGKTSLGFVYDSARVPEDEVSSPEKVIERVCRDFPLLARDLRKRQIVDQGLYRNFSYDCQQTISANRWALSGEAGRFTDPLYSPGGDLIALHNTLITDAILTDDHDALEVKTRLHELLVWAFYESYVPGYAVGYDTLGDQECFGMKYGWELTVYFTFYVFPFINQVFTHKEFVIPFLELFARLGTLNHKLQAFLADYYQWKKNRPATSHAPVYFDFTSFEPLKKAEELFYQVGLSPAECIRKLKQQIANVEKFARFIAVHIYSVVLNDASLLTNKQLAETLKIENLQFDEEIMRRECSCLAEEKEPKFAKMAASFNGLFPPNLPDAPPGATKDGIQQFNLRETAGPIHGLSEPGRDG